MPIRACWNSVVAWSKKWRPAKRRRQSVGFLAEAFESRRMLSAFFVNSLEDSHDANPGDGIAADANGATTLRAAIEEANAHIGADSITLPVGRINVVGSGFTVTDALTIHGAGGGQSVIDGLAFDHVFQFAGSGSLNLSGVTVNSARELAAASRSSLLTTNSRQADLVIAFSSSPNAPFPIDTKPAAAVIAPLIGFSSDNILDSVPLRPDTKLTKAINTLDRLVRPDNAVIPTPDAAIEDIVNALFESESSDLVLPIGAEKKTTPMVEDRSTKPAPMPMSDSDRPAAPASDATSPDFDPTSPFDGMMSDSDSDDEQSLANPVPNDAVQAVLSGWADEAGWRAPDFWTNGLQTQVVARPESGRKLGVMVAAVLSGISAQSWSTGPRWLRDSVNVSTWRRRLAQLGRRAR